MAIKKSIIICRNVLTWEIRERSSLDDVLSVQSLQNLGAAKPLEATLHIIVIPFERLRLQNPVGAKGNTTLSQNEQMAIKVVGLNFTIITAGL